MDHYPSMELLVPIQLLAYGPFPSFVSTPGHIIFFEYRLYIHSAQIPEDNQFVLPTQTGRITPSLILLGVQTYAFSHGNIFYSLSNTFEQSTTLRLHFRSSIFVFRLFTYFQSFFLLHPFSSI